MLPETLPWQAMRSAAGRAHQAALLPLQARCPAPAFRVRLKARCFEQIWELVSLVGILLREISSQGHNACFVQEYQLVSECGCPSREKGVRMKRSAFYKIAAHV